MSRPPRLDSFAYVGPYRYFLTICTRDRRPMFTDPRVVEIVCTSFRHSSEVERMAITAYCAMPDHFHLLAVGLAATSDLRHFMERSKQQSGWSFKQRFGCRLWQEGYYDHVLRDDDDDAGVIAYIVNNPIRAGLVTSCADYPFWGSLTHTRAQILEFIAGVPEWQRP